MMFGPVGSFISTLIEGRNSLLTENSLSACFEPLPRPLLQSDTTVILVNVTPANLIDSIVPKTSFLFLSSLSFSHKYQLPLPLPPGAKGDLQTLKRDLGNGLRRYVAIGTWAIVKWIRAVTTVGTVSAASVMGLTEPEIRESASQPSTFGGNNRRQQQQHEAAVLKAREAAASGTRQLKRKAMETISDVPRFKRGFVWDRSSASSLLSPSALSTESAPPLASPPSHLLNDPTIQSTLRTMRDYIRVETPFNIDRFEAFLHDHPNQPFVKSVMSSLRNGFWPFDEGIWKNDHKEVIENYPMKDGDIEAIRAFRDGEVQARHWSDPLPFYDLLPGMKLSPIFVIWQRGKLRVVTDHTASGLNDYIPRSEASVHYDDMRTFGQAIFNAKRSHPDDDLVTWKSDVSLAFLNLPAHPIYQLRQVIDVEGIRRLIHQLVFGNRASPRCWCSVAGLMCWIAIKKFDIKDLHDFMDDFFSWGLASDLVLYKGIHRPRLQARLLMFWDAIGCPWKEKKQEFGKELKIIGFYVDINQGTLTLTDESISEVIAVVRDFLDTPSRRPLLREWLRVGGHLNWVFNVLPLGRPALGELYRKVAGKSQMHAGIALNAGVRRDLEWLLDVLPKAIGVHFVSATHWEDHEADLVLWTVIRRRNVHARMPPF